MSLNYKSLYQEVFMPCGGDGLKFMFEDEKDAKKKTRAGKEEENLKPIFGPGSRKPEIRKCENKECDD